MSKSAEDDIQKKLVELELSIKDEDTKRQVPSTKHQQSTEMTTNPTTVDAVAVAEVKTEIDLYDIGGWLLCGGGLIYILSKIQLMNFWNPFMMGSMHGLLLLPLLVGLAMLIYNYKSKVALALTLGTIGIVVFLVLSHVTFVLPNMTMLDAILMGAPLCVGAALLAKAQAKRRQLQESTKLIK